MERSEDLFLCSEKLGLLRNLICNLGEVGETLDLAELGGLLYFEIEIHEFQNVVFVPGLEDFPF